MQSRWLNSPTLIAHGFFIFIALAAYLLGFIRGVDSLKIALWGVLFSTLTLTVLTRIGLKLSSVFWQSFAIIYIIDIATQGVLRSTFGVNPSPSIIAQALANTQLQETQQFVLSHYPALLAAAGFTTIGIGLSFYVRSLTLQAARQKQSQSATQDRSKLNRIKNLLVWVLAALTLGLHFNPSMLRQQPLLRWPVIMYRHHIATAEIEQAKNNRLSIAGTHADWRLLNTRASDPPKTVVLIIGESANRHNWSWYGYSRPTTTALEQVLAQPSGHTLRFTNANSGAAYTLQSLRLALTPADTQSPEAWKNAPDFLLMAKQTGYRTAWLSNQVAHEGWLTVLGKSADFHAFVNVGNWRDSTSTDFDLLSPLQTVLNQTAPHKELIVMHQMGQHFHFDLRCPNDAAMRPFKSITDDAVMQSMKQDGRSSNLRQARNDYDDAVFCGAVFTAQVLKLLQNKRNNRELELIYFSDHGQEVGHTQNIASHAPNSTHGYSIPLFIWSNQALQSKRSVKPALRKLGDTLDDTQPYLLNDFDHLLQGALGIRSRWYRADLDPIIR